MNNISHNGNINMKISRFLGQPDQYIHSLLKEKLKKPTNLFSLISGTSESVQDQFTQNEIFQNEN